MRESSLKSRQLWAWVAGALTAPLAYFSGAGWLAMAAAAAVLLPLAAIGARGWRSLPKMISVVESIWLAVVLAELMPGSAACWPGAQTGWFVPLSLLVLAALSGAGERGARVGAVLSWILLLMYLPLAFAGAAQVELRHLTPVPEIWPAGVILTLLIPSLTGAWGSEGKWSWYLGIGALAVALGGLTQGILGQSVAQGESSPLYEVSRQLGRFETLVAVAMTFGWYSLASMIMDTAAVVGANTGIPQWCSRWAMFVIAGALILFDVRIPGGILMGMTLLLWILVPLLWVKKRSQKSEKSS